MEGILTLSQAGANTITATNVTVGDSPSRGNAGFTSELNLGGAANTINANRIVIGDSPSGGQTAETSSMTLGQTNVIAVNTFTIGQRKSKGSVDIAAGGTLTLTGSDNPGADLRIGYNNYDTGSNATGILDLTGATFNATLDDVTLGYHNEGAGSGSGTVIMDAGDVTANSILLGQPSANGTSSNPLKTTGTWQLRGGTLTAGSIATGGGTANFDWTGGRLTVGTFGFDLLQQEDGAGGGGTLAPGGSPGTTVVTGNYDMEAGIYEVEIAGLLQGVELDGYDFVEVTGDANLGDDVLYQAGADSFLQVLLRDEFLPDLGDTFDVLTAVDVTLGVDFMLDQSLSGLVAGGFIHRVIPGGNGEILQLQYVPEPGTLCLAILGLVCLAAFGWRRRSRIPW